MLIYNVTLKIDHAVVSDWVRWMQNTHIPEMLGLGLFEKANLCRLLDQDEQEGLTFVAQYFCPTRNDYDRYLSEHAAEMRQKGLALFKDKMIAFRTLMEVL